MSIAITDEQRAIQQSIARLAGIATVRALETGSADAWRRLWPDLADIGLFSIALPERLGGAGGDLDDQCAALEQSAVQLVPGPVLPTVLAAILLARHGDSPLIKALADGTSTAAVALTAGTLAVQGETGRVSGEVRQVLGAHPAAYLLLTAGDRWFMIEPGRPGVTVSIMDGPDFSRPAATIRLDGVAITGEDLVPGLRQAEVTDLAVTLASAEAAGIARWCVRTAAEYSGLREQFGRKIGSFQAIKHLCADMLARSTQAGALAWDAARALRPAPAQFPLAAAIAAAVCVDAAVDNAKDCIQVLGGIGFTWEHDAHLYLRRALALRQFVGDGHRWRTRVADLALTGARRRLSIESGDDDIRRRAEEIAALPPGERRSRLVDSGYLVPHWPPPYGLGATARTQLMIDTELARAGITRPDLVIGAWAAPTIIKHGTDAQRERFVLPTLRGEIEWCQLFSEPGAGSDLASLRTSATRTEGGWRLNGQKVWTSRAREADWAICLARTDPDVPKHKGISYFLVDMRAAGIDVRPLREITGAARFNEVFLDSVFVPDDCVVGEVNGGWALARTTLAAERVALSTGSSFGEAVERLLRRITDPDPVTRQRLGGLVAQGAGVSLVDFRATLRQLDGQESGADSSLRKLIGVRHRQAAAELAYELTGDPELLHDFLLSRCLSIAGGTTQVLLNLIGERLLGLPRE